LEVDGGKAVRDGSGAVEGGGNKGDFQRVLRSAFSVQGSRFHVQGSVIFYHEGEEVQHEAKKDLL